MIQMNLLTKQKETDLKRLHLWLPQRRDSQGIWDGHVHTATFKMDHQQGPTVQHREPSSMLYGSLDGRKTWGRMDTCICMAQSLHCSPETVITLFVNRLAVQFSLSVMSDSAIPWTAAHQAPLSITNSWSLLKLMSIELVMPPNHLIHYCPLLLLPSVFPSIRVFSNESVLPIRWPKCWSFSFSISPSNEYSALISFRIDWFDLPAVQETLKSLLQHHNSKASVLQCSAFFIVQLSYSYVTTKKPQL